MSDCTIRPLLNSKVTQAPERTLVSDRIADRERGFLIAFEGPDGSGKSTQLKLFREWLLGQGHDVVTTKWKSAPALASLIKSKKEAKTLSPQEYCLLHAADFLFRLENTIVPALGQGKIVLCDRYVFTALTRDASRGLSRSWILSLFEPLLWPDMVFYFSVSPETSLKRILATREPKYYEAGQDVTQIADPSESFKVFISRVLDEYEKMSYEHDFLRVDAEQSIRTQQRYICASFQERFEGARRLLNQPSIMRPVLRVGVA